MLKKTIIFLSITIVLAVIILMLFGFFTKSKPLTDYIFENMNETDLDYADIYVPNTNVEILEIKDKAFLSDICDILEKIEIKTQIFNSKMYYPTFGDYYIVQFYFKNNSSLIFMIMDKNHIVIYDKGYIITSDVDLKEIYQLLVEYGYLRKL